jgi:hypothetical protein
MPTTIWSRIFHHPVCYAKIINIKIYRTIILPVVVYGRETWSLTLREEHRLRVWESRVQRKKCGPKRDEVTGDWNRQHNELYKLYSSSNNIWVIKSRRMRLVGHVAHVGGGEVHTGFLWGDLRERDHLEDLGIVVRILLKLIFKK